MLPSWNSYKCRRLNKHHRLLHMTFPLRTFRLYSLDHICIASQHCSAHDLNRNLRLKTIFIEDQRLNVHALTKTRINSVPIFTFGHFGACWIVRDITRMRTSLLWWAIKSGQTIADWNTGNIWTGRVDSVSFAQESVCSFTVPSMETSLCAVASCYWICQIVPLSAVLAFTELISFELVLISILTWLPVWLWTCVFTNTGSHILFNNLWPNCSAKIV